MSQFCPNCGNQLDGGAAFCPKCGAKTGAEVPASGAYAPVPKKSRKKFIIIASIIAAVVIAVTVTLILVLSRDKIHSSPENIMDAFVKSVNEDDYEACVKTMSKAMIIDFLEVGWDNRDEYLNKPRGELEEKLIDSFKKDPPELFDWKMLDYEEYSNDKKMENLKEEFLEWCSSEEKDNVSEYKLYKCKFEYREEEGYFYILTVEIDGKWYIAGGDD